MSIQSNEHSDEDPSSLFSSPQTASITSSSLEASDSGSLQEFNDKDMVSRTANGKKKSHHPSALQTLLDEANRYNSQYDFALPKGFLRDRNQNKRVHEEHQTEPESTEKTSSRSKRPNTKPKAQSNRTKSSALPPSKFKQNGLRSSSRSPSTSQLSQSEDEVTHKTEESAKRHVSSSKEVNFIDWNQDLMCLEYDIFDIPKLRQNENLHELPTASTLLTSKRYQDASSILRVALRSPLYPTYREEYHVDFSKDSRTYNPMSEVGKLIEYAAFFYLPEQYARKLKKSVIPQLNAAFDAGDDALFADKVEEYNKIVEEVPRTEVIENLQQLRTLPRSFIHDLLHTVYTRSIHPNHKKLKEYEAFSNYVYGELLPNFLSQAYLQCGLNSGSVFMDLGSGVGNCVVQAALEFGCKLSFGCEIMSNASDLTELQNEELIRRCNLAGLKLSPLEFSLRKSFVDNVRVDELIPQVDVLLINNFLFDSDMNRKVEKIIQNVKVGCKIITLKNLRPCGYVINFFNLESILNRLKVERFELKEGSVSWTHNGGEYFISTVLPDVDDSLFDPSVRKRNTKRPTRYTR